MSQLLNMKVIQKPFLEAMAAGCIVIAPNVTGVNEIIENNDVNGILYEFDTVDNLPALIQSLDSEL